MASSRFFRFLARFNPAGALGDFAAVWQQAGRRRWYFALAALAATAGVFSLVGGENFRGLPRPPEITYINSWRADRSDAEIRASNIAHEKRKEAEEAELARRAEDVRQIYKTIGRLSGMDVDAIERRAQADRAASAEAEAAEARQAQMLQEQGGARAQGNSPQ